MLVLNFPADLKIFAIRTTMFYSQISNPVSEFIQVIIDLKMLSNIHSHWL